MQSSLRLPLAHRRRMEDWKAAKRINTCSCGEGGTTWFGTDAVGSADAGPVTMLHQLQGPRRGCHWRARVSRLISCLMLYAAGMQRGMSAVGTSATALVAHLRSEQ